MKAEVLARLRADRAARRPVALLTNLKCGDNTLIYLSDKKEETSLQGDLFQAASAALRDDKSRTVETAGGAVFIHVHNPPMRLVIVGAVHIAQPLSRMAAIAGYAVTVVDPRRAFASDARFPHVEVSREWPDEALRALAPDARTAVVTLTHDPKLDDPALEVALRSPAFYVGALGSGKTHAGRRQRLAAAGIGDDAIARIHGPVGLSIGALSPAEIALAIMAQITQVRHRAEGAGGAA